LSILHADQERLLGLSLLLPFGTRSRAEGDQSIATPKAGTHCVTSRVLADTSVDGTEVRNTVLALLGQFGIDATTEGSAAFPWEESAPASLPSALAAGKIRSRPLRCPPSLPALCRYLPWPFFLRARNVRPD
jgi:hypothetical protein